MIEGDINEHYGFYCDIEKLNSKYDIKYVLIYKNNQYRVVRQIRYSENKKNNLYNRLGILPNPDMDLMEMNIEYSEKNNKNEDINEIKKLIYILIFCICFAIIIMCLFI